MKMYEEDYCPGAAPPSGEVQYRVIVTELMETNDLIKNPVGGSKKKEQWRGEV